MEENAFSSVSDPSALQAAAIRVILRNRILRPIAGGIFDRPPELSLKTNSKLQAHCRRTTNPFNDLIALLKAAYQRKRLKHGSPFADAALPGLSNSLENLPAESRPRPPSLSESDPPASA